MAIFFDYILGKLRTKDSSGGGGGTVTSVALALPTNEFTISGSPIINFGTLTGTWKSQTANKVFAAPSGGAGTPTFRVLVAADIPFAGDIKSTGAVNFVATQSWLNGTNRTDISSSRILLTDSAGNTGIELNNNGSLRLIDNSSIPSDSIFRTLRLSIAPADVRAMGSGGTPQLVVPLRANYTGEIESGFASWEDVGGSSYDGITSLYFFSNGANSNQFQIDCPSTILPYKMRGIQICSISKDNLLEGVGIYMTTDFISAAGDATLILYLHVKETRTS